MGEDCPFCRIVRRELAAAIVHEDEETLALLDLHPATRGHTLVLPKRHVEDIFSMPEELGVELMATAVKVARTLNERLGLVGLNLVQANGAPAGQTIFHFHLHLVPRYDGDSVVLRFGHGSKAAEMGELQRLAALLRGEAPRA